MKESFDVDPYLEAVNDRHTRKFLSFIRLSCHPLNIEYGRYKGIPTLSKPVCSLRKEIPFKSACGEFPFLNSLFFAWSGGASSSQWIAICWVRKELLTFSLRKLFTSSFILNFSECMRKGNRAHLHYLRWKVEWGQLDLDPDMTLTLTQPHTTLHIKEWKCIPFPFLIPVIMPIPIPD